VSSGAQNGAGNQNQPIAEGGKDERSEGTALSERGGDKRNGKKGATVIAS